MKKFLSVFLILSLMPTLLAGCGLSGNFGGKQDTENNGRQTSVDTSVSNADPIDVDFSQTDTDMFTDRDMKNDFDTSEAVTIQLNGTSASASSDSVKISGSSVTVTEEATYIISGTLSDGMIVVDASDTAKLQLVLNGVNVTNSASAALYITEADKVFVTLADGTENTLANGGSFEAIDGNNIDGAVYSRQDLTFNGSGSLTVTSPA